MAKRKKKKQEAATLGDLLVYLQMRGMNLRNLEEATRTMNNDGWLFVYGTSMYLLRDKEILERIPRRKEWNAYGR